MPRAEVVPLAYVEHFVDGLGCRYLRSDEGRDTVEILRLCRDLASMRAPVADRVERQSTLRLAQFVPVRAADAPPDDDFAFEVVSDHVPGVRLSAILKAAGAGGMKIPTDTAFHIVRQVLGALSSLHLSRGVAHGAVAPERVLVTDKGHVLLADHVLGAAIERLEWNRPRLWRELGVPAVPGDGPPRFDERTDVLQVGVMAVALLAGRPLAPADYPARLPAMVDALYASDGRGGSVPMAKTLKAWLRALLWMDPKSHPASAREALAALEAGLVDARRPRQAGRPVKDLLDAFVRASREAAAGAGPIDTPVPAPAPLPAPGPAPAPVPAPVLVSAPAPPPVATPAASPVELVIQPVAATVVREPDMVVRRPRREVPAPMAAPRPPRGTALRAAAASAGAALRRTGAGGAAVVVALGAGLWRVMAGGLRGTAGLLAGLADGAVRGTLGLVRAVAAVVTGSAVVVTRSAAGVLRAATGGARAAGDLRRAAAGSAASVVSRAGRGVVATSRGMAGAAGVIAAGTGGAIRGGANALVLGVRTVASGLGRGLRAGAGALLRGLTGVASGLGRGVTAAASGLARALLAVVRGADALGGTALQGFAGAARLSWSGLAVAGVALTATGAWVARVAFRAVGLVVSGGAAGLTRGTAAVARLLRAGWAAGAAVAAGAAGGRAAVLPVAQAVRRAGSLEVSRPVVCAALLSVIAWPGIQLARAQWQGMLDPWLASEEPSPSAAPARASLAATTGGLRLTTDPSGAQVWIDGRLRGGTPLALAGLRAGRHTVVVRGPRGSVTTDVQVAAGETAEVAIPIYPGWLAVFAPVELQVLEGGASLGTTEDGRMLLLPGSHTVELVSERLGFTSTRTIEVRPGDVAVLNVELPPAPLEIVAPDGAEVWVDGRSLGLTPLPPQHVAVGTCEVVVRHPELGEFRQPITITYRAPNRIVFEPSR